MLLYYQLTTKQNLPGQVNFALLLTDIKTVITINGKNSTVNCVTTEQKDNERNDRIETRQQFLTSNVQLNYFKNSVFNP